MSHKFYAVSHGLILFLNPSFQWKETAIHCPQKVQRLSPGVLRVADIDLISLRNYHHCCQLAYASSAA